MAHHDRLVADNRTKWDLVSYCSCYSHFFNVPGLELSSFESSMWSMKENDVAERSPLPRRHVCVLSGELMPLLSAEARMVTRRGIHLNCNKTSGRVDMEFVLPRRSVNGQTARCEDRGEQIEA